MTKLWLFVNTVPRLCPMCITGHYICGVLDESSHGYVMQSLCSMNIILLHKGTWCLLCNVKREMALLAMEIEASLSLLIHLHS